MKRTELNERFKLMIPDHHLNLFAVRDDQLYFYVLTNRRLIKNLQLALEIEVWRWND